HSSHYSPVTDSESDRVGADARATRRGRLWAVRPAARARPKGAAIHQKGTLISAFLFWSVGCCTGKASTRSESPTCGTRIALAKIGVHPRGRGAQEKAPKRGLRNTGPCSGSLALPFSRQIVVGTAALPFTVAWQSHHEIKQGRGEL